MSRCVFPLSMLAIAGWLAASSAHAQTATASVSGVIVDESGAATPGVTVSIKNRATGASRTVITDDRGRYSASNLEPGAYELRAELSGFKTALREGVVLTVGGASVVDIQISVGQVEEVVIVTGRQPSSKPRKPSCLEWSSGRRLKRFPTSAGTLWTSSSSRAVSRPVVRMSVAAPSKSPTQASVSPQRRASRLAASPS